MNTVAELVSDVEARMRSYTGVREQVTSLSIAISDTSTTLQVDGTDVVSLGLIQIDDELIEVLSSDGTVITTAAWGRGAQGSTAASHAIGAKVTNDPLYPRAAILAALNRTCDKVEGILYKVTSVDLTPSASTGQVNLPADTLRVLTARLVDTQGIVGQKLRAWTVRADNPTGVKVLSTGVGSPYQVRITYAASFGRAATMGTTLTSLGWDGPVSEILALGAITELAQTGEAQRTQLQTVAAGNSATTTPPGSSTNFSKAQQQQFAQALQLQQQRLIQSHDSQYHWTV